MLSGCASAPPLESGYRGTAPQPAGFALIAGDAVPDSFETAIEERLAKQGFSPSDRSSYQLQLSLSEAPGKMGLVAAEKEIDAKTSWTMSPARSRSTRTYRATLSLTEAATGRELFHAHANVRARKAQPGTDARLADALVAQLHSSGAPEL